MFENLKIEINQEIKPNGIGAITGSKLNDVLQDMVASVEEEFDNSNIFTGPINVTDQQRNTALANVSDQTANASSGKLGYKVLDPAKTFAQQVTEADTIYEIKDSFSAGSQNNAFVMPNGVVLKFNGGRLSGRIDPNGATIDALDTEQIFDTDIVFVTGKFSNDYVTPDWFGARHDTEDDSPCIQAAVNTGNHVKFSNEGGAYNCKSTITISTSYQELHRDFCNVGTVGANRGAIIHYPSAYDSILFSLVGSVHDVKFYNLRIITAGSTESDRLRGYRISCVHSTADKDITIRQCSLIGGYCQVVLKGRGCEISNCDIAGGRVLLADWENSEQTGSHPSETGQRAIRITDNRLHSIASSETFPAIYIRSGHAPGLTITNNVWDNGRGPFFNAEEDIWNALITNNIIQFNAFQSLYRLAFYGGVKDSIISGNICNNYEGYWTTQHYSTFWMVVHSTCKNVVVRDNQSLLVNRGGFYFEDCAVEDSVFSSNSFSVRRDGQTNLTSAIFTFTKTSPSASYKFDRCVVENNRMFDTNNGYDACLFRATAAISPNNCYISYNFPIKIDGTLGLYLYGNVGLTNCVYRVPTNTFDGSFVPETADANPIPYYDSVTGRFFFANNGKKMSPNGLSAKKIKGTTAERPTFADATEEAANEGYQYYDTDLGKYICWNGSQWTNIDGSSLI